MFLHIVSRCKLIAGVGNYGDRAVGGDEFSHAGFIEEVGPVGEHAAKNLRIGGKAFVQDFASGAVGADGDPLKINQRGIRDEGTHFAVGAKHAGRDRIVV